ncbi:type I secretion outer membrane protein, TolC family [Sideroxydans lithotrophicus ES-1]|uniref:Type I secretion outer membrane protein, TolC family n=2 Tax=Sideroxydans TaxID=314343 RepID=D5CS94_SIDLE|nr:type I secretion outer membrane protein, TolC family [Sideroxydans lithotrophicus ES-1]
MRIESGSSRCLHFVQHVIVVVLMSGINMQADAVDLLEIYHLAQANDPTFEASLHGYEAAQEKFPQARAGNLPTVTLTGNRNFTDARASFNGSTPNKQGVYAWTWQLQLTQPIMRPQNILAYYESEAQVDAAQAEFSQAEQDMILRVAQAYFDALVAQETVATAEAQLQAMQAQEAVAKRGFELGTVSITDSDEARSKAEQARAQLIAAQNDLETKLAEIEKLTGKPVAMLSGLKPTVVAPKPEPADVSQWVEQAKDNNPTVRAQFASLRAAGYTVTKAKAENFWTLDFVGSYGANYSSGNLTIPTPYETRVKSSVAGIQFTMPIFAGGLNSSHMREAVANQGKLSAQLEEARRKAGAEAKQAYMGIVNGVAQTEALQSAVESGESSVKGNQAGYRLGLRINSDVLNAQQQLFASKRDLAKARYDTLFAGLKLKAAAGVLSESDVQVINGLLGQ